MDIDKTPGWDADLHLKQVNTKHEVKGGALRDEAGGTLHPSGHFRLNIEGSECADAVAVASGVVEKHYIVEYRADPVKKVVVAHVVTTGPSKGAMQVLRTYRGRAVVLHLGGVFKENPTMRPAFRRTCPVYARTDSQGRSCLVIAIGVGVS